ncbi:aminopeptidase P family N-terminal domain-containing protein, partial [Bradyrhizobium sp. LMTR 3]
MERRQVEVLVVTSPANITYLSGYTSKSAYVP